jgi:hypothetical protein
MDTDRPKTQSSASKINTKKKPKRLVFGKSSAISEVQEGEYVEVPSRSCDEQVPGKVTKVLRNGKMMISLIWRSLIHWKGGNCQKKPCISSYLKNEIRRHLNSPGLKGEDGLIF